MNTGVGPCHPPGHLPDPGIEPPSPASPALQANSLLLSHKISLLTCLNTCKYKLKIIKDFYTLELRANWYHLTQNQTLLKKILISKQKLNNILEAYIYFFNWSIIALQYCVSFSYTTE